MELERIILASSSPRRKELLEQIGIPFVISPSDVEEKIWELEGTPAEKAEQLALSKAKDVAEKLQKGIVLGADTIVVVGNDILGKPKSGEEAVDMLNKLNGKVHKVITGIAVINIEKRIEIVEHEVTSVRFRKLTTRMIRNYVESKEPEGKAGAYAIQGKGAIFVESIEGCYTNVVGLPLARLSKVLEKLNYDVI